MQEDAIKQSLNALWDESMYAHHSKKLKCYSPNTKSFLEVSNWWDTHRCLNEGIVLPRITAQPGGTDHRVIQSHSSDSIDMGKRSKANWKEGCKGNTYEAKSVSIQFGLPHGMRGFQKEFYHQHSARRQADKKRQAISPKQSLHLQQPIGQPKGTLHLVKTEQQLARQSIVNQLINRRNRLRRQQHLMANRLETRPKA